MLFSRINGLSTMKAKTLSVVLGLALGMGCATARTWKSADGTKTFDAEFTKLDGNSLTVTQTNGKTLSFPLGVLSSEDQTFAKEEAEKAKAEVESSADSAALLDAVVAKELKGKLEKLDGKSMKKFELAESGKAPKYYLVYFSASW
jgi:hypothetical protein